MEEPASPELVYDPTITLKIRCGLSNTGHLKGSGVKILMCHISLAQGLLIYYFTVNRNANAQWCLPGSLSATFLHRAGCKSCYNVHAKLPFSAIYVVLNTGTEQSGYTERRPCRLRRHKTLLPGSHWGGPEVGPRISPHQQQVSNW